MPLLRFPLCLPIQLSIWGVLTAGGLGTVHAYTTISTITPQTVNIGSSTVNTTGAGGNVVDLNPSDTFTLNYGGSLRTLKEFTAGGTTYGVLPVAYSVNLIRNSVQQTNNILWQAFSSSSPAITTTGVQNFTVTLPGVPGTEMESAFSSGSLDTGTDNLFVNAGDANGNMNNIERLDVYYSSGLISGADLAFPMFERGTTSGHDAFGVAAILTTDAGGNPTSYGPLVSITSGWGNTSLGALNTLVQRNLTSNPGGLAQYPAAYATGQFLGGTTVMALGDLGVTAGTKFYGYSLFGGDVTAAHNLLLPGTFPTDTPNSPTGGGVDMIGSFQAFRAIPEPASPLLALTALAMAFRRRRVLA